MSNKATSNFDRVMKKLEIIDSEITSQTEQYWTAAGVVIGCLLFGLYWFSR